MNPKNHRINRLPFGSAVICLLTCAVGARAQEQVSPSWVSSVPESTVTGRNPTDVFVGSSSSAFVEPVQGGPAAGSPFRWGPVVLDPHPSYGFFYNDGILVSPGQTASTTRQDFAPGFLVQLGPIWTLDYTPTWEQYSNRLFHDGLDQAAQLKAANSFNDWTLQFAQDYTRTYQPLVETGRQTREQGYATEFKALYGPGDRTVLELGVDQNIQLSPVTPDSYEWSTLDWLHRRLSPQWDAALGGGFGVVVMDPGFNMTFVRPEGRITWQIADQLNLDLQGGVESRTFLDSMGPKLTTAIFNAAVNYQPAEATKLIAAATRDVEPGYSLDQVDQVTKVSLSLQQRLLQHFYLGAEIGRQDMDYILVGEDLIHLRSDHCTTLQLSLTTVLFRRLSLSIQYSSLRDDSNVADFGFLSHQYGIIAQYRF